MIGLLRRHRIDLVHANNSRVQLVTGPAARCRRIRSVWHWRDFLDSRWLNWILATTADVSITTSQSLRAFAIEQIGSDRIILDVPNGVSDRWECAASASSANLRTHWKLGRDDVIVGMLGQLTERKGHQTLIRAFATAIDQCPRLRLVLCFSETSMKTAAFARELRRLVFDLNCGDHVVFHGYANDVSSLMREIDIVALPSLREPFGRVAVEAMLAQRPVVASNVDGLGEIVVHQETGRLTSADDHRDLANALVQLSNDPTVRQRFGQAGRKRALERYSPTQSALRIRDVYEQLADC